jgi:hypothetical protein
MYEGLPSFPGLFWAVAPSGPAGWLFLGLLAVWGFRVPEERLKAIPVPALLLAAGLALLPPLVFFCAARAASLKIWVVRYFMYYNAGLALCAGILLSLPESVRARRAAAAAVAAAAIMTYGRLVHADEDWRAAAEAVRSRAGHSGAPVVVLSPYVESDQTEWLSDPEKAGYLSAPLAAYPAGGRVIIFPRGVSAAGEGYLRGRIKELSRAGSGAAFIGAGGEAYDEWLAGRFLENGCVRSEYRHYGGVTTMFFSRRPAPPRRGPASCLRKGLTGLSGRSVGP